jgi:hypothetical protein
VPALSGEGFSMADYESPNQKTSGAGLGGDATGQPGQYPSSLFGVGLPQGTGAAGSNGASGAKDPTNAVGQYPSTEPISGVTLGGTGAPGSPGATEPMEGGTSVTYQTPDFYKGDGVTMTATKTDEISGPNDWTAPPGTYPPQHPITSTPVPTSTGAGQGRVLRGGRRVR